MSLRCILNGGPFAGKRLIQPEWIKQFPTEIRLPDLTSEVPEPHSLTIGGEEREVKLQNEYRRSELYRLIEINQFGDGLYEFVCIVNN